MTSDETPNDPRVNCPKCGKRFRVPASTVGAGDSARGAPARCSGCGTSFLVRAGADGSVAAVAAESEPPEVAETTSPREPRGGARRKGRKGRRATEPPAASAPRVDLPIRPARPPTFGAGERVSRYEIEEELGRGGMGAVYAVFDPAANRHVAMKVLASGAPDDDRARFQREVEVQGNIQHPHIMPIFDSGTIGRSRYFTMELLKDPLSLTELVDLARRGQATRDPMLRPVATLEGLVQGIVLPICRAIYHANVREGVLHRDLKPDNVLIDHNGLRPFVIDFGICSLLERKNTRLGHLLPELPGRLAGGGVRVTGTLLYMPPEQARGQMDRRGDVWALGAILHFVVSGGAPFARASGSTLAQAERIEGLKLLIAQAQREGKRREEAEFRQKLEEVESGTERSVLDLQRDVLAGRYVARPPGTPEPLNAIIDRAMAVDPEDRYRHAQELHDDLKAWLAGHPTKAELERRGVVGRGAHRMRLLLRRHRKAAALLVVALGVGAWAAVGLLGRGDGGGAVDAAQATQCLVDARAAVGSSRFEQAETLAREALAPNPCAGDAVQLLADLEARRRAVSLLDTARAYEETALLAWEEGRLREGRLALSGLAHLLASGAFAPLEGAWGTYEEQGELERLASLAAGRRRLTLQVPGGAATVRARRLADDTGGFARGEGDVDLAGDDTALVFGRWILGVSRGQGEVWFPLLVTPGEGALPAPCPVDPGAIEAGRVHVISGRVRGPLGEATVVALRWERTEVTAARYATWLAMLPVAERRARAPRAPGLFGEPDRLLWALEAGRVVPPADAARLPVESVSVYDARAFAKAQGGRLPTAAEWAWAAAGPVGLRTPTGDLATLLDGGVRIATFREGDAAPVGTSAADRSLFGLMDMAGNVAEMTQTLTTLRGTNGWLVMGGGYATPPGRALVTEAEVVPGWMPLEGVGFRVVYDVERAPPVPPGPPGPPDDDPPPDSPRRRMPARRTSPRRGRDVGMRRPAGLLRGRPIVRSRLRAHRLGPVERSSREAGNEERPASYEAGQSYEVGFGPTVLGPLSVHQGKPETKKGRPLTRPANRTKQASGPPSWARMPL